jgi:hypothetical protein
VTEERRREGWRWESMLVGRGEMVLGSQAQHFAVVFCGMGVCFFVASGDDNAATCRIGCIREEMWFI